MKQTIELTPTSFIVLGLLERAEPATPYELKRLAETTVGNFWSVPHSQMYSEPVRLAAAGYLSERRERSGRRRRHYSLTAAGRKALAEWRDTPTDVPPELRDLSLLKLFFEGEPRALAAAQRAAHEAKLAHYRALLEADTGSAPRGPSRTLAAGIAHEREWVRFWAGLEEG